MAIMGAFIAATGIVSMESLKKSLPEVISKRNIKFNEMNIRAIDMGYEFIQNGSAA
jgi:Pyruvate/2-oxoacid:ferredoxin oxidoreductase gamma subunit